MPVQEQGPSGISGWLALVTLLCVSVSISSLIDGFRILRGFSSPHLPEFLAYLAAAVVISGVSISLNLISTILLFVRSPRFPFIFVASLVFRVGKNFFELWAVSRISSAALHPAPLITSGLFAMALISYMACSARVRNTFASPTLHPVPSAPTIM
jgi:hypothetical protein